MRLLLIKMMGNSTKSQGNVILLRMKKSNGTENQVKEVSMELEKNSLQDELGRTKKILADPDRTLPALIFSLTGSFVCRITGRKEPLPWQYNFVVVALIIQLPTLLISLLLNETKQWMKLGFLWMGYIELGLLATVVAHIGVFYVYKNMNSYIVDSIQRKEDLIDLQKVFGRVGSLKNSIYFTLFFTVFWCISFSWFLSEYINQFIGLGLLSGTIIFGLLTGPAVYLEGCYYFFITHLGNYTYVLNETSPAHSQVIYRISRIVTVLIYSIAFFIAFATASVAFIAGAVVLTVLIGWIPTIVYFIASQLSISRIVTTAKWQILTHIQEQIRVLNSGDITNKKNIEAINRLMDYHERVRSSPNSTLSIGTGVNFINQLALPLVGLLLANIDKVRQILLP